LRCSLSWNGFFVETWEDAVRFPSFTFPDADGGLCFLSEVRGSACQNLSNSIVPPALRHPGAALSPRSVFPLFSRAGYFVSVFHTAPPVKAVLSLFLHPQVATHSVNMSANVQFFPFLLPGWMFLRFPPSDLDPFPVIFSLINPALRTNHRDSPSDSCRSFYPNPPPLFWTVPSFFDIVPL